MDLKRVKMSQQKAFSNHKQSQLSLNFNFCATISSTFVKNAAPNFEYYHQMKMSRWVTMVWTLYVVKTRTTNDRK